MGDCHELGPGGLFTSPEPGHCRGRRAPAPRESLHLRKLCVDAAPGTPACAQGSLQAQAAFSFSPSLSSSFRFSATSFICC